MEDKEAGLVAADTFSNRNGNRVLPAIVVLGLAMMLYAQFPAGVPMNSAIALPIMLGYIRANDCGHPTPLCCTLLSSAQRTRLSMRTLSWLTTLNKGG